MDLLASNRDFARVVLSKTIKLGWTAMEGLNGLLCEYYKTSKRNSIFFV